MVLVQGCGVRHSASVSFVRGPQCGGKEDAAQLEALLRGVGAQAVPRRAYVGHGLVICAAPSAA